MARLRLSAAGVILCAGLAAAQNPVPFIESPLDPPLIHVRTPGTTLRITGTGFVPGSLVQWNGTALSTVYVSNRQLTATVPAANLVNPGTALITVFNPATKGRTSNAIPFVVSRLQTGLNFFPVYYETGMHPSALLVTDLNHDGRPDLVVANSAAYTLSVLIGNGDGTFQPPARYLLDFGPTYGLAAGDFNGDGNIDIAAAGYDTCCHSGVTILQGNGDGTLMPGLPLMPAGSSPRSVITADFNGDGNLDLAVANYDSSTVSVMLGNGDLTFQPHLDYSSGKNPIAIAPADLNNDGILDVAVLDLNVGVSTLAGQPGGTFTSGASYPLSPNRAGLSVADLDGNGWQDLIVSGMSVYNGISIFSGIGAGSFMCCTTIGTPGQPNKTALGDFNGDGITDLAVANNNGYIAIFFGNGDGTFQPANSWIIAAQAPDAIVTGDFNNDGRLDIAVTDRTEKGIYVMLQDPMSFNASVDFGHQQVGTTSKPQFVNITSTSGTLNLGAMSIATGNASDFTFTTGCGSTLQSGKSCVVRVYFTPSMVAAEFAQLQIPNLTLGVTETVMLYGTGR